MSREGVHPEALVHPSAVVEEGARVGAGTRVGAFAYVGPHVELAEGVELRPHAYVVGRTRLGEGAMVFPFAVVGEVPQDLKYAGEPTRLTIGPRTIIREHAQVHIGTEGGGGLTEIGADCLIMGGVHVAHDCRIGNRVILVNNAGLAGHVQVGDGAIVGGLAGVHQWVRIGQGAMVGGLAKVTRDVIPYGLVDGPGATLHGLNLVGLKRRGLSRDEIGAMRSAYDVLKDGEGSFADRAARLPSGESVLVDELRAFVSAASDRHFLTPRE
ncbi:acyl-ACP--UDP-N-acetylglucosamine O-acyltransferase [Wenxinia marina]|uniref:Acyl-[acyl-carrier-protein]--UDP-N-acetylglucosamine O-acyltransferase n=1 Tax=Wenxinia marina DSM 24838 TaxID=1123501 RepID=A0A0D0Q5F0_9RHOB|nr:acyl-ACP--UDP-N-acetylglucosamine O-acyltransferase [Wenxinia marina]KIQ67717.1 acyl-[acyl-carrier-protein]--UDP-N-acetylglucosamine O-acyltransferase [Wenxinia marina DSM 24838]GGL77719.1 acyl-[acyl-carrier-protein]--UDP-N-acetylglucosamine O-acyltransferase [Wenxinia marina]